MLFSYKLSPLVDDAAEPLFKKNDIFSYFWDSAKKFFIFYFLFFPVSASPRSLNNA
jgi:hypothetical protein